MNCFFFNFRSSLSYCWLISGGPRHVNPASLVMSTEFSFQLYISRFMYIVLTSYRLGK